MSGDMNQVLRNIPFVNPLRKEILKVNYIVEMWATPCTIPFRIMVRTLFPATLNAFYSLTAFTSLDIMAQGAGIARRRFLKKLFKGAHRVTPLENAIKDTFIFEIFDIVEIDLFYFFIAEMVTDFLFEWTTLMHAQAGCKVNLGTLEAADDTLVANINNEWTTFSPGTVTLNTDDWPIAGGAVMLPEGLYSISYTGSFEWLLGPKGTVDIRALVTTSKYVYECALSSNGKSLIGAVANLSFAMINVYPEGNTYVELQIKRDDDNPVVTDGLLHNYSFTIAKMA